MTTEALDPFELYARLNPISHALLDELAESSQRETTFARVAAQRGATSPGTRRLTRRRLVAAVVVAVALALPALALSGVFGSLFRFSNRGTPVKGSLSAVTGFNLSGAKSDSAVQLAARGGVGIYGARTSAGDLCYFVGPADQTKLKSQGLAGGCMNAAASARFPSAAQPVVDMSLYALAPGELGPSIQRLAGVAADGVASVQLLALSDCRVVATAPVIDNVYAEDNLPLIPEAVIVARDASGNAVWHLAVTPPSSPNATTCGLG
jgi:hypothetical protein